MLVWLISSALAAGPMAGHDVSDVKGFDAQADALLAGPAGCWEVIGRASWSWDFGHSVGSRGDLAFIGRLVDGTWEDFVYRSLGEDIDLGHRGTVRYFDHTSPPFVPLVGRLADLLTADDLTVDDPDAPARDLLTRLSGELHQPGTAPWAEWSEPRDGVVLHRTIGLEAPNKSDTVAVDLFFPGGATDPTEAQITWPSSYTVPGRHPVRARDGHATLTARMVDGVLVPEAELLSFGPAGGFFRLVGTQSVQYRVFRRCGGAVENGPNALGDHVIEE